MKPQTILITGATHGIGHHAALTLAARGHRVIATGRNAVALTELRKSALAALPLDVTDAVSIDSAVREVERLTDGRGLDVLINNAGHAVAGPLIELDEEALRRTFDVNVFGPLRVTRAFAAGMIRRGAGRVINISSVSGYFSLPLAGAYHASKWALETLSDSLRMELGPLGIAVVVVAPGTIRTGFLESSCREARAAAPPTSAFGPAYARLERLSALLMSQAVGPEVTSRAIVRAVEASRPSPRYVTPRRAQLLSFVLRRLPTALGDALLIRATGLSQLRALTSEEQ